MVVNSDLCTVKAPNIAHLSALTSIGFTKKKTQSKNYTQRNILYLHKVQNGNLATMILSAKLPCFRIAK